MHVFTKKQIGEELKNRVLKKESMYSIGNWAHSMYLKDIEDTDFEFDQLLLDLRTMALGSEFEYTYEKLLMIADKIISGQYFKL